MKVGDYVRTPLGITKYLGKYNMLGDLDDWYEFDKLDENLWFGDIANVVNKNQLNEVVIKSSPNIIDLIEVGDYVNGHRVLDIAQAPIRALYLEDISQTGALIPVCDYQINSIVTKEQFKAMQYEVK